MFFLFLSLSLSNEYLSQQMVEGSQSMGRLKHLKQ